MPAAKRDLLIRHVSTIAALVAESASFRLVGHKADEGRLPTPTI